MAESDRIMCSLCSNLTFSIWILAPLVASVLTCSRCDTIHDIVYLFQRPGFVKSLAKIGRCLHIIHRSLLHATPKLAFTLAPPTYSSPGLIATPQFTLYKHTPAMAVIASEHPPSPLLQKLASPFLCVSKASRACDTLAETPLLDEDVPLKPCTRILNPGSPTLIDKASRLDICEEKTKWLPISSNNRASRLPGKTPGEHYGCVCRGGESRGACH